MYGRVVSTSIYVCMLAKSAIVIYVVGRTGVTSLQEIVSSLKLVFISIGGGVIGGTRGSRGESQYTALIRCKKFCVSSLCYKLICAFGSRISFFLFSISLSIHRIFLQCDKICFS